MRSVLVGYDATLRQSRGLDCGGVPVYLEFAHRRMQCPRCGVKREHLPWLADNPRYTQRFVLAVGRRCRASTIKDVADDLNLHWGTVKELDIFYMRQQLELAGPPAPTAIGIDELSPSDQVTAIASSSRI